MSESETGWGGVGWGGVWGLVLFQSYPCWPRLIPEASDKALNI